MKNIIHAINAALAARGQSLRQWANAHTINYSTIHSVLQGRRPNDELLQKLCNGWPDDSGLHIARAHLDDELERTGRTPYEITIAIKGDPEAARAAAEDQADYKSKNL